MGRSRGGLTTKVHALVDAAGRLIELKITPGQAHDGRSADDMLDTVQNGCTLLADRACDSDRLRAELTARGATTNVRAVRHRKAPPFDRELYKKRNVVERPPLVDQQARTLPCRRNPLRQARRQPHRVHQACRHPHPTAPS